MVLFWLFDMSILCQQVNNLELRKFLKFCVAHLPVKREIRIATLPQQPKILKDISNSNL